MTEKSPSLCVLVIEDERLIRWAIAETLADAGHTTIEASDACTALAALTASHAAVDVIVLDYRLPDSNDLTLLACLRRLAPACPIVLITAHGTPEVYRNARALGVFEVLGTPFDMRDFAAVVRKAREARVA
jgi:DNA-binding NtrC family response regulator